MSSVYHPSPTSPPVEMLLGVQMLKLVPKYKYKPLPHIF